MMPEVKSAGAMPARAAMAVPPTAGGMRVPVVEQPAGLGDLAAGGFLFLCVFVMQSRVTEQLGLGGVASSLLVLALIWALLSGSIGAVLRHRVTLVLLALLGWEFLASLFGVWRGGSIGVLISDGIRSLGWYIAIAAIMTGWRRFTFATVSIACSGLYAACWALLGGEYHEGRLEVGLGTFADPNALAMFILVSLPMWWMLMRLSNSYLMKGFYLVCTLPMLLAFAKTGSRGGLLALAAMVAVHFLLGTAQVRVRIAVCTVVAMLATPFFVSGYLLERFMTFFSVSERSANAESLAGNDVASSISRQELLMQSLQLTAANPVLGIGPGNFADVIYKEFKTTGGTRFINHATHNTFTQYSCEAGIPAALLFFYCMAFGVRGRWRRGREQDDYVLPEKYGAAVHYLRLSMVVIATCAISLSFAYKPIVYIFLAMMAGLLESCQSAAFRPESIVRPMWAPARSRT